LVCFCTQSGDYWTHTLSRRKIPHEDYDALRDMVEKAGGQWQVPVLVPAGSMILWLSSTIHSAKIQDPGDDSTRCVVYVCQRPKNECNRSHGKRLTECLAENRVTNHWGTRKFPTKGRYPLDERAPADLVSLVNAPKMAYARVPLVVTAAMKALTSLPE